MITLVTSIIGVLGAAAPHVLDFFKRKQEASESLEMRRMDYEQERTLADKNIILQDAIHENKIEDAKNRFSELEMISSSEINKTIIEQSYKQLESTQSWIINCINAVSASVRPFIAYTFTIMFILAHVAPLFNWIEPNQLKLVYTQDVHGTFVCILSYYFSDRGFKKLIK